MEVSAKDLIRNSLAPSSQRAYAAAQSQYGKFCQLISKSPIPASEQILVLFTAYLAQTRCHSTVRVYLAAVRHLHISNGWKDPMADAPQLGLAMRGVKRKKPAAGDARLPITPLVLQAILGVVRRDPHQYTNIMMWAACCLGYFAFLRSGEFTTNAAYDPEQHMAAQDVAIDRYENPSLLSIRIKQSKTDQARAGITLYMGRTGGEICPISNARILGSTQHQVPE